MASDEPDALPTVIDRPHAPVVYFEVAPISSYLNGLGRITLSANFETLNGKAKAVVADNVVTAHLRSNIAGFVELRAAIDRLLLLAQPTETGTQN